ncbi:basic salivary proline-rich protein 1-like [Eumetopias jubatus]|uniref:basic salivary proline-rich protein 1-like n=1 Tax=Eumetopias jubatus TaxID=34886 RepID=UPI001016AF78|nr:basic salivary proline-rich protein 1-like [Eumetopias jubatus]
MDMLRGPETPEPVPGISTFRRTPRSGPKPAREKGTEGAVRGGRAGGAERERPQGTASGDARSQGAVNPWSPAPEGGNRNCALCPEEGPFLTSGPPSPQPGAVPVEDPRGPVGRERGAEAGERRVPPLGRGSRRRSHPRPARILLGLGSAWASPPSCGDGRGTRGEDEEAAAAAVRAGAPGREGCWAEGPAEGRAGSPRPAAAALQGAPPRPRPASARECSPPRASPPRSASSALHPLPPALRPPRLAPPPPRPNHRPPPPLPLSGPQARANGVARTRGLRASRPMGWPDGPRGAVPGPRVSVSCRAASGRPAPGAGMAARRPVVRRPQLAAFSPLLESPPLCGGADDTAERDDGAPWSPRP